MMWEYKVPGIPDDMFEREEDIPMTKEEVRVVALSKLRVREGDVFLDVGSGSGSVSVEASLLVGERGKVVSVDSCKRAVELTKRNVERFKLKNVEVVLGESPQVLQYVVQRVGKVDRAFVGGTRKLEGTLKALFDALRSGGRVVVSAVLLETASKAISSMEEAGFVNVEVVELIVAKGRKIKEGTMMLSRNPVFLVSGEKP
ncbi:MAG: precorrin-6Y C5,15-methyltransferase (decarboxylating) subunit CbiT [Candidatus Aramenus sp.]|nr:precorrin-6Y C5,15-methyltransferase (decarboxylating) subunit CbiT [Candidatus Aramenus sp.]